MLTGDGCKISVQLNNPPDTNQLIQFLHRLTDTYGKEFWIHISLLINASTQQLIILLEQWTTNTCISKQNTTVVSERFNKHVVIAWSYTWNQQMTRDKQTVLTVYLDDLLFSASGTSVMMSPATNVPYIAYYYVISSTLPTNVSLNSVINACTVLPTVVKANSHYNWNGQISTSWGSETPRRILMKLWIYNYIVGMTAHANICGAATTWVVRANTWLVDVFPLSLTFWLFLTLFSSLSNKINIWLWQRFQIKQTKQLADSKFNTKMDFDAQCRHGCLSTTFRPAVNPIFDLQN